MARRGIVQLVAGLVLVLAAAIVVIDQWALWGSALGSRSWSTVVGQVQASDLLAVVDEEGFIQGYVARVRYTYLVNGRRYEGNRVNFHGSALRNELDITAIVERYPEGAEVRVFYDPLAPPESVLETGASTTQYLLMAVAVVAALAGLGLAAAGVSRLRADAALAARSPGEAETIEAQPRDSAEKVDIWNG